MQCVGKNGGLQAGGLRLLLPLFSVAAFLLCGGTPSAFADTCAVNDVGITTGSVINTGTINCINIQNSTVSGNVTNAAGGAINATGFFGSPTDTGIVISNNASVSGSVSNAGTITASLAGINVFAPVFGGIANSGTISAFAGIGVDASTFSGGISNSGTITTVGDAIVVGLVSNFSGGIGNTGTISSGAEGIFVISDTTFSGGISNSGTISAINDGIFVVGVSTYSGGIVNSGTIITSGYGMIVGGGGGVSSFSGGIANSGTILADFNGISVAFLSSFSGGISNSGTISAGSANGLAVSNVSTFAGNISNSGTITGNTGIRIGDSVTFTAGSAIVNSGTIIGTGGTAIDAGFTTSPVTIAQTGGLIAGDIKLSANADVLNISGGTINGNIVGAGASNTVNFALGSGTFTYNSAFTGINQVNINSGTVVLNGANIATNVDVKGGTLAGSGSIDPAVVTIHSGATFAPGAPGVVGTSMNIVGNLAFQSGAIYLVTLGSTTASRALATGTATLNGTVQGSLASGSSLSPKTTYDILHAGSISGAFNGFANPNFTGAFTYTPTDVLLNLTGVTLGAGAVLNHNQQNVANAINNFFNNGGSLPPSFATVFGLSGGNLANALTQLSGETATGSQQVTFNAMGLFLGLMADPFIVGRGGVPATGSPARPFAEEDDYGASAYASNGARRTSSQRDAYGMITKAPPRSVNFDQRWSVWAAGFGGSQTTDGNTAVGSNTTTSRIAGTAVGADYRFSPSTIAGFALAGGGTNFSVANALGSGRSDLFQAGAFVRHDVGAAYFSSALAYGWQDITTNRTVTVAGFDQLRAEFNANAWSGRVEGGYRFVSPWIGGIGITPYAAGQFTTFDLPAYAEQAVTGANTFALAYGSRSVTDTRSELGLRSDKSFAMPDGIFTLRGRVAWAHDFNPDRTVGATFQTLPGASFVVNGAAQASDSALVTASVEKKWLNGWSAAATFEGEFSNVTTSYAGKGVVRYTW
jgi:uncharacterized protein YhjY with autotransporter beta-barrel domain